MTFMSVKNLGKAYELQGETIWALKGVSFDLNKGETLAVLGSSGAGKSTLLNLLGGLDVPTQGDVLFEGKSLANYSDSERAKFRNQELGFVFQFHHLLKDFTVIENVMMPLLIAGVSQAQAKDRAATILNHVGLGGKEKRLPKELSGGEQQRVALARGVVHKPKLILADEPTGNLDDSNALGVFELLCQLNHDLRATLIVVTHNQDLAKHLQKHIVLQKGQSKHS